MLVLHAPQIFSVGGGGEQARGAMAGRRGAGAGGAPARPAALALGALILGATLGLAA